MKEYNGNDLHFWRTRKKNLRKQE